jgi:hypothetical protein
MIPLINYLMTVTRQAVTHIRELRWFKLIYTMQGKFDTHNMYAFNASPCTSLICFLQAVLVRGNLSRVINSIGQSHCSQEKRNSWLHPHHVDWPICVSPSNFSLPHNTIEAVEKVKYILATNYIDLLSPYHQYVISTFNICSRVPTPQSLTNIDEGYNFRGVGFQYYTPHLSNW